jgi:hypothetical protein
MTGIWRSLAVSVGPASEASSCGIVRHLDATVERRPTNDLLLEDAHDLLARLRFRGRAHAKAPDIRLFMKYILKTTEHKSIHQLVNSNTSHYFVSIPRLFIHRTYGLGFGRYDSVWVLCRSDECGIAFRRGVASLFGRNQRSGPPYGARLLLSSVPTISGDKVTVYRGRVTRPRVCNPDKT